MPTPHKKLLLKIYTDVSHNCCCYVLSSHLWLTATLWMSNLQTALSPTTLLCSSKLKPMASFVELVQLGLIWTNRIYRKLYSLNPYWFNGPTLVQPIMLSNRISATNGYSINLFIRGLSVQYETFHKVGYINVKVIGLFLNPSYSAIKSS